MAFVNEYISDHDRQKYGLDEIDNSPGMQAQAPARDWTIDHERNIYLRYIGSGHEEFANRTTWHFYWSGELVVVDLLTLDSGGKPGEPCWAKKKIHRLPLPSALSSRRDEIVSDLYEAIAAHKDNGVFSKSTTYTLTLVSEDCNNGI
jgi:hypothetical protein